MDPEIRELLDRLGTDNPPEVAQLQEARADLVEALREATNPDTIDLTLARAYRDAIDAIDADITRREEEAAAQAEEAAQLLDGIDVPEESDDEEPAAEPDEDGGEDDSEDGDSEEDEPEVVDQPEPIAAGLNTTRAADGIARARERRAARRGSDSELPGGAQVEVFLSGTARGTRKPKNIRELAEVFHRNAHRSSGRQPLVSLRSNYPEERALTASVGTNTQRINGVIGDRALVAAGGVCAPLPADFAHPICGERSRPIRDSLPQFNASRGGVRYMPSATLADMTNLGATSVWTHETDANPSDQTKPCPRVDCEDEVEVIVDAVTACLRIGNFQARFNTELWESRLDLLMIDHDRLAEITLWNTMEAAATAVDAATVDGSTAHTLFMALDRAAAGLRSRHRVTTQALRMAAPSWLRMAIRSSLIRIAGADALDAFEMADAVIDRFFTSRNIRPVWSPDVDPFGAQGDGALLDWPNDEATIILYPEGTFFFLDGGTLDLGTDIRDSTLNKTNDLEAFMETFEAVALRGCEALAITLPIGEDCICGTAGDQVVT